MSVRNCILLQYEPGKLCVYNKSPSYMKYY